MYISLPIDLRALYFLFVLHELSLYLTDVIGTIIQLLAQTLVIIPS